MGIRITLAPLPPIPPIPPVDLLIGRTLYVSTQGLGGVRENLTNHYNDVNAAVSDVATNLDCVHLCAGIWNLNSGDLPGGGIQKLNMFLEAGALLLITNNMPNVGELIIGGYGTVFQDVELSNCSVVIFDGDVYAMEVPVGDVETEYVIRGNEQVAFTEIDNTGTNMSFYLTSNKVIDLGAINISSGSDFIFNANSPLINVQLFAMAVDTIQDQRAEFNGQCVFTALPGIIPIQLTGTAADNVSSILKFNGDVFVEADTEAATFDEVIFSFSNYSFTHEIVTNDVTTEDVPIFTWGRGGIILKSCNIKSRNAQRNLGVLISAANISYVQLDDVTFSDVTGHITSGPDVFTAPIGQTMNAAVVLYSDHFAKLYDPLNITNNIAVPVLQYRLSNFEN